MKKIKVIANYGALAHEKETVYTFGAPHIHADVSEEIILEIPDEFGLFKNDLGQYLVDVPTGETLLLHDVLAYKDGIPVIRWYSGGRYYKVAITSREVQ